MAAALLCNAQPAVHVAFNLGNCVAHSRQLQAISRLNASTPKLLLLAQEDSAIAPIILERFGIASVEGLSLGYLPTGRLSRYFSPMGSSSVFVLLGPDTVARFPLEELPDRIDAINTLGSMPSSHLHLSRRPVENSGRVAFSSHLHIAAGPRSLWIMDRFLQTLLRVDLTDTAKASLHQVGTIPGLLAAAPSPGPAYSKLWVQPDVIGLVDAVSDEPTVLVECIDTVGPTTAFHRLLLTVRNERPERIEETDIDPRPDDVFPSLGPTGFVLQGDRLVGQVMKNMDDGKGLPLFAHYERRDGMVRITDVAPYDHHRGALKPLNPYDFTNGRLCDRYFVYASIPIAVDLRSWKEVDLSASLPVALDSALALVPGHYYTLDMQCDEQGMSLLCVVKGKFMFARFDQQADGLRLASLDPIDMGDLHVSTGVLMDRNSFVFISRKKDELLIGRYTP